MRRFVQHCADGAARLAWAVARINVSFVKDDGKGRLEFTLPELDERRRHDADVILDTMLCGVSDLREAYSDFIDLEVD